MNHTGHSNNGRGTAADMHQLRLMSLLQELERDHGRKKAAKMLGIHRRTLDAGLDEGVLSRRMRAALDRALQSGVGSAAAEERERSDRLEERAEKLAAVIEEMRREMRVTHRAWEDAYRGLRAELAKALKSGSKRLLATYLQTLLAYPDGCTNGETVFDPRSGDVIVQVPPLSEERLYPKEKALVDLVAAERLAGRRVLVYVTHTGTRDITGRMEDILTRHGFRVAVMKAGAVEPKRREAWVADRVKQGIDVLVCHPRLVQTGLDLIDFPTIIWGEVDYSIYVSRQASRRSWRIGQTRPVKVVYMAYRNTLQADALKMVAKKLQSSLAVEGELPEDGLAAFGDEGDDMTMARKIVSGEDEDEAETVEAVFAQARDAESAAEELLVDDGWKPAEVEPETVAVNGNGRHETLPIGPTVELVPTSSHNTNGNGANSHHDGEAPETQQSLFSWGEFMAEERVKPKRRNGKPQPATLSMFEWAMTLEREAEPVGAER